MTPSSNNTTASQEGLKVIKKNKKNNARAFVTSTHPYFTNQNQALNNN